MSQEILNTFSNFKSFKFDPNLNIFVAMKHHVDAR